MAIQDPMSNTGRLSYNDTGKLITHTDANVQTTRYYYNAFGRRTHKHSETKQQSAGARTIIAILWNEPNIRLTRYLASTLMKSMGMNSCQTKTHKYKHADQMHKTHDNILDRRFSPSMPNQVWTGDVTYIRIKGGWCYLAVVLDLFARRVVGFAVSDSPDSVLTAKALQMAYQTRLRPSGVLFHSDQGNHYTSKAIAESVMSCDGMI